MGEGQRLRAFDAVFAFAILAGVANFAYHAVQGDFGLFAIIASEAEERTLTADLAAVRAERATLENRVARLNAGFLDLDILDETARDTLGLIGADEVALR
ncbi:MAG: septum formation initiator precursor [Rhodobacterales bacterium CG18_big_fil_WC_8_21_14_2_50_71_9]|nr:MAG: septum formation initiator precursor [Rhodobacterales bacterium CG18_big_fil_WC_8_21_14_2_50_71_9]